MQTTGILFQKYPGSPAANEDGSPPQAVLIAVTTAGYVRRRLGMNLK